MNMQEKIEELRQRQAIALKGGGESKFEELAKKGRLHGRLFQAESEGR